MKLLDYLVLKVLDRASVDHRHPCTSEIHFVMSALSEVDYQTVRACVKRLVDVGAITERPKVREGNTSVIRLDLTDAGRELIARSNDVVKAALKTLDAVKPSE